MSISGKGKAKIDGDESFSVLTTVPVADGNDPPNFAGTPLGFPTDLNRAGLSIFTSSASLTGKLESRQGTKYKGTLYTQDTGVITNPPPEGQPQIQIVGQILKIVGGTEDFAGATGTIAVAGQEVGGAAFYTGEVCVKRNK